MKFIKKHKIKALVLIILAIIGTIVVSTDTKAAITAPESFIGGSEKLLEGYIADVHYAKLNNSIGDYVYCRNIKLDIPYGVNMTYEGEAEPGISYIISNGFPRKSITGNSDKDYYITQAAIWWYLDDNGANNLSDGFKYTGSDSHDIRKHIVTLVEGAKKATKYATADIAINNSDNSLTLTTDKKYYESKAINVESLYTTGNYTVTLDGAPANTKIVNASSGIEQTTFNDNETFKVKVPVNNVDTGSLNIKITVTATGSINKAYKYKSSDPTKQSVYTGILYPETTTIEDTTNLVLETSKVTITKIAENTNEPLAGATFVITDSNGKEITTWVSTTASHVIRNLPNGTYILKETKAPAGYDINTNEVKFIISDTNRNIAIRFKNKASAVKVEESKVTITKIAEDTNEPLAGATFVITDSKGKEVTTWVSTTNSHVIKNLPNGTYTLKETKAPTGYELNPKEETFTISDTARNIDIKFKNKAIEKGKVTIIKVDETTKTKIAGATLLVKDSNGKEIAKFKTTTKPYVINNLEDGKYTVEEIEAPKGYKKTDKIYNFTIDSKNKDVTVTIENKAIEKLVTITKIDAVTKEPLYGATLVVKDSEGNVVEQFVTTKEGYTITGLKDGEYTVEEVEAPAGYKKSDEIYRFTIGDETPTAFVFFENNEIVEVPFTGSNKSLITTLFGGLLLISGVGFVYYNDKKQKA